MADPEKTLEQARNAAMDYRLHPNTAVAFGQAVEKFADAVVAEAFQKDCPELHGEKPFYNGSTYDYVYHRGADALAMIHRGNGNVFLVKAMRPSVVAQFAPAKQAVMEQLFVLIQEGGRFLEAVRNPESKQQSSIWER